MRKHILGSLSLLIFLFGCGPGNAEIQSTSYELPPSVDIVFQALVPENTTNGEAIYLTLLDPLTGFEINPQLYEMNVDGERSFSVTLSVPIGSLLTYRYSRGNDNLIHEKAAGNFRFEYRLFLVDGPGHVVTDLIASWADSGEMHEIGGITGSIKDAETGLPLENMHVSVSGINVLTNSDGEFSISGLLQGLHTIVAFAESGDYKAFQQGALVATGLETPANIQLEKNEILQVSFAVKLPEENVPGVPVYLISNLAQYSAVLPNSTDGEGRSVFSLELPVGTDIRYKYSLGDGFWNAEHTQSGEYLVRQINLSADKGESIIEDQIASWEAGESEPIWFELTSPAEGEKDAYIQFKFVDWTPALQMWPIGDNRFAYKLNSPTNFAAPLEYRYCEDFFCIHAENMDETRAVQGNLEIVQYIEDQVNGWK
jgi:hypothetical protein